MNSDGTNHQKLTSLVKNESNPRWSPDGKRISFISNSGDGNGSEIFIYWVDSKQYSSISQLDGSPRSLNWSPDGKSIGFLMFVPEKTLQLVSPPKKPKNAKWAEKPRITDRLTHEADGSRYMREGFSHIFNISSDGGKPTQVTKEKYNHREFDWKSDSKGFVFSSNYNIDWQYDYRNSELYSINIDGSSLKTLTDRKGPDRGLAVSPDGKKIAYLGYNDKVQTYQITRLYIMNIDGGSKKEIKMNLDRSISSLKWSSDNKGLYFMYDNEGNTKVAYSSLGGKTTKLVDNVGVTTIGRPYGGGSYSISKNNHIVYTMTSPYNPADLVIYENGENTRLSNLNYNLFKGKDLGEIEDIWYESSVDGRKIQGWIAKPPGFDPKLGSVNPKQPTLVPFPKPGNHFSFCFSDPYA